MHGNPDLRESSACRSNHPAVVQRRTRLIAETAEEAARISGLEKRLELSKLQQLYLVSSQADQSSLLKHIQYLGNSFAQ